MTSAAAHVALDACHGTFGVDHVPCSCVGHVTLAVDHVTLGAGHMTCTAGLH